MSSPASVYTPKRPVMRPPSIIHQINSTDGPKFIVRPTSK